MPRLDWSRVGNKPETAPWIPVIWGGLAVAQLVWWFFDRERWLLYAAGLWALGALVYVATAAGWLPAGKRRAGGYPDRRSGRPAPVAAQRSARAGSGSRPSGSARPNTSSAKSKSSKKRKRRR